MLGLKKKIVSQICGFSFLAACVGTGFGAWYFMSSTSATDLNPVTNINASLNITDQDIQGEFVKKSLLIKDSESEEDLSGIIIRMQGKYYTSDNTLTSIVFSSSCQIKPSESGSDLNEFIEFSDIKATDTVLDNDNTLNSISAPETKIGTKTESTINFTIDLSSATYDVNNLCYNVDFCVFPCFSYLENRKPSSYKDYSELRTIASGADFSFNFDLLK